MNYTYNKYSEYLKKKYGEKVYKLPISLPVTCPNRDGCISYGGCTYCGDKGAGFENLSDSLSVSEQLKINMEYINKKYKANKFIAYFQNYTNTYIPLEKFKEYINSAIIDNIVDISISTRPDCINTEYLKFLKEIKEKHSVNITMELGLQTVNYHTLNKINRGHSTAEYIDAVLNIKKYGFDVCTHIIINLPWDDITDVTESAKFLSALKTDHVKLHALYILKNTIMGKQYENREFEIISLDEYVERTITFLEYLSPKISIQRLIGRAPENETIFSNWNTSWWKIKEMIEFKMEKEERYQGNKFNYLNGSALNKKGLIQ